MQTIMTNNHVYMLIGAPRSGLELLSQCMNISGFSKVNDKKTADPGTINQLLFQDLGITPYTPALPADWNQTGAAYTARERINKLLSSTLLSNHASQQDSETMSHRPAALIADSLLSRTLPLWKEVFSEHKISYRCLHIVRHPWEVALYLSQKQGIHLNKALVVWLSYIRDAFRFGPDQTLILFDQILADPITACNSLFAPFPTDFQITGHNELLHYVQPSLKHFHSTSMPDREKHRYQPYDLIYQQLRKAQYLHKHQLSPSQSSVISTKNDDIGSKNEEQVSKGFQTAFPPPAALIFLADDISWISKSPDLVDTLLQAMSQEKDISHSPARSVHDHSFTDGATLCSKITITLPPDQPVRTEIFDLINHQWQKISFSFPGSELLKNKDISLYPLNKFGTIKIASIKLLNKASGQEIWSFSGSDRKKLVMNGPALHIPDHNNYVLFILNHECCIDLVFPENLPDSLLSLEIWLQPSTDPSLMIESISPLISLHNWQAILESDPAKTDSSAYQRLASFFSHIGQYVLADKVLCKGVDQQQLQLEFLEDYAGLSTTAHNWTEAVQRWQFIADVHGTNTPQHIYENLKQAYQHAKFKGKAEEEIKAGELDYMIFLEQIHSKLKPELYLEIGVQSGKSLAIAECPAIGIDPMPEITCKLPASTQIFKMTSDVFFQDHAREVLSHPPDLVFIDGMHLFEYALRDFMNIEKYSGPWTLAVIDDIFPNHPAQAERLRRTKAWTGDVWKLYEILKRFRPDLFLMPINTYPTGLLLISGLNNENDILWNNYDQVVKEYSASINPNDNIISRHSVYSPSCKQFEKFISIINKAKKYRLSKQDIKKELSALNIFKDSEPQIDLISNQKLTIIHTLQRSHAQVSHELLTKNN